MENHMLYNLDRAIDAYNAEGTGGLPECERGGCCNRCGKCED